VPVGLPVGFQGRPGTTGPVFFPLQDQATTADVNITPRRRLTWSVVQFAQSAASSQSISASVAGNLIIVAAFPGTNGTLTSVTDNVGNTYVKAGSNYRAVLTAGGTGVVEIWYAVNIIAGATTVTLNGGTTPFQIAVWEVSGLATVEPFDNATKIDDNATQTSPLGPTIVTTEDYEFVISAIYTVNVVTGTVTGEFSNDALSSGDGAAHITANTNLKGPHTPQWTQNIAGPFAGVTAAFKTQKFDGVAAAPALGTVSVTGTASVTPTGVSGSAAIGTVSVIGTAVVNATGVAGSAAIGTVTVLLLLQVNVTGVSASPAIGTVVVHGDANVLPTGVTAAAAIGTSTVTAAANVNVTGVSGAAAIGTVVVHGDANATPTGVAAVAAIGTSSIVGNCNTNATGVSGSASIGNSVVTANCNVNATGVSGSAAIGTVTVTTSGGNVTVNVTGVTASATIGTVTITANCSINSTGVSGAAALGTSTLTCACNVVGSGVAASSAIGTSTVTGNANVNSTGVAGSPAIGTVTIDFSTFVHVTGVTASAAIGTSTFITDAVFNVTGVFGNAQIGTIVFVRGIELGPKLAYVPVNAKWATGNNRRRKKFGWRIR
jgi:hypothetical protein